MRVTDQRDVFVFISLQFVRNARGMRENDGTLDLAVWCRVAWKYTADTFFPSSFDFPWRLFHMFLYKCFMLSSVLCFSFNAAMNLGQKKTKTKQTNDQNHTEPYLKVHWQCERVHQLLPAATDIDLDAWYADVLICRLSIWLFHHPRSCTNIVRQWGKWTPIAWFTVHLLLV